MKIVLCHYLERFAGILRDLLACNEASQLQPLADRALQLVGQLLSPLGSQNKDKAIQLRGLAIALWNKAVSMKSGGNLVLSLNAQRKKPNIATIVCIRLCKSRAQDEFPTCRVCSKTHSVHNGDS